MRLKITTNLLRQIIVIEKKMDEKTSYKFKKSYTCKFGEIAKGREITFFRGIIYLDGLIIPEPYASDIKNLFEDDNFIKEYIDKKKIIKNKV